MKINTKSLRSGDIREIYEQIRVRVVIVGNSEDTLVNLIHKVMNGKYDDL